MSYPRHENNGAQKKRIKKPELQSAPVDRAAEYREERDTNSRCVEEALDGLTSVISTWVTQERNGDNGSGLYSSPNAYPVRLDFDGEQKIAVTLSESDADETMSRFVTALERIADSVARLAGLSRPRLESWHSQDKYGPRYKSIAADDGATGPKTD